MSLSYRPDIDGLRTVAVLPVVVFHAGLGLDGGFVGVDVFFVVSGYLITSLLLKDLDSGCYSILDFYERRARRILPALFAMMAIVTLAALVLFVPSDLYAYGKSLAASSAFLANVWFYLQEGYFTEAAELKPLLHTWSLGVEEQYYLFFPLLILLLYRALNTAGLMIALGAFAAGSFALSVHATSNSPNAAFYLPQYRIWELLVGSLLAVATARNWLVPIAQFSKSLSVASLGGLLAILAATVAYGPETRFPGVAALAPCLGAALVIATGGLSTTPVSRLLSTRPFVFIGKVSYSFYLWHWPVIAFTYYTGGGALETIQGVSCVAISFLLACGSWAIVERPFRDRRRFSQMAIFAGSGSALVSIVLFGGFLTKTYGLPGRMPDEFLALTDPMVVLHDRRDCHFVTPLRASSGDVCIRGDLSAEPSFALVGDSHADALSPAIFTAAEELGLAGYQYTNSGFRPLDGVSKKGNPDWGKQTDPLIAFLSARPQISTIFITAYWEHQMTGYTYRHEGHVWEDAGYDGSGTAYNQTATINGIRQLAERLPEIQIVLLDDVPTGETLHIKSQLRAFRFGHTELSVSGLERAEADAQRRTYETAFSNLAAAVFQIDYYPIHAALCGEVLCPLFDGDTLLFRDGDHLSFQGALNLNEEAKSLLQGFLMR